MANEKHLAILKQGVRVWNEWREKNSDIRPGLSYANLSNVELSLADLSNAALLNANLNGADLQGTILNETDLTEARLGYTTFANVDLIDKLFKHHTKM